MLLLINEHLSSGKETAILWNFLSLPLTALATIEGQSSTPFLKDSVPCPRMTYPQRTLVMLGSHWFTKHGIFFPIREQDIESVLINPRKEMHEWGWTPLWRFIKVYGKYLTGLTHKAVIPFHWCQDIFVQRVMTEPLGSGASVFIAGMQNHLEQHPLWSSEMSNGCVGAWSPLSNICRISNSITGEMGKDRLRGGERGQGQKLKNHMCVQGAWLKANQYESTEQWRRNLLNTLDICTY